MNGRVIRTVCIKELRDAIRDPRSILYLVGLPLIFYPALLLILEKIGSQGGTDIMSAPYRVSITRIEESPTLTAAFMDADDIFTIPSVNPWLGVVHGEAHVGIEPCEQFEAAVAAGESPVLTLYVDLTLPVAREAFERAHEIVSEWRAAMGGEDAVFEIEEVVLGHPGSDLGFMVGLFPYFLVVLILVGAAHMAIDITAGEKERRTLETLLVTPARRLQILLGKATATVIAAMSAGVVGMAGFAMAIALAKPLTGGTPFLLSLPPHAFWILGLGNLPAAFFLSAMLLALGTFARSSREGPTYAAYLQMPLLLLALIATFIPPDPNPLLYLVPLLGTNLIQKEYLIGIGDPWHAAMAVGATLLLGALLAVLAARMFSKERVLFRE